MNGRITEARATIENYHLGDSPTLRRNARLLVMTQKALGGARFADIARWANDSMRFAGIGKTEARETSWDLAMQAMWGIVDGRNPGRYAFTDAFKGYAGYKAVRDFKKPTVWLASGCSLMEEVEVLSDVYSLTEKDLPFRSQDLAWSEELYALMLSFSSAERPTP